MQCRVFEHKIGSFSCKLAVPKGHIVEGRNNGYYYYQFKKDTSCKFIFSSNETNIEIPEYSDTWKSVITHGNHDWLKCKQKVSDYPNASLELSDRVKSHFGDYCNNLLGSQTTIVSPEVNELSPLTVLLYTDWNGLCLYFLGSNNEEIADILKQQKVELIRGRTDNIYSLSKIDLYIETINNDEITKLPVLSSDLFEQKCFDIYSYLTHISG